MNLLSDTYRKQRGFSLLEILVAFSILAFSLGVLFQIYSRGANVTALSRDYSRALIVAQSQLAMVDLEDGLVPGIEAGVTMEGITWQRQIDVYEDETNTDTSFSQNYQLVNVLVEVGWKTRRRPYGFSLKSLRLAVIR